MTTDDEPIGHILREMPPWTTVRLTVCGRPAGDVARLVSFDEAKAFYTKHGKKRTYFEHCVTCIERAQGVTWMATPVLIAREWLDAARRRRQHDVSDDVTRELHALGVLVERHRDEYDALALAHDGVPDLAQRRRDRNIR